MAVCDIVNIENKPVGTIELMSEVFELGYRPSLIAEIVHWQRAKRRAGTQSAKTRGEVHGTAKKPFKQKGTGSARQGDKKSPHMRGGGVAFAPKPRDYGYAMPAAKKRLALAVALSARFRDNHLTVVDSLAFEAKTKKACQVLKQLDAENVLIVDLENQDLKRSTRNLQKAKYLHVDGINVFDILKHRELIISASAVQALQERLTGEVGAEVK